MTANIGLRFTLPSPEGGTIHVIIQPTTGAAYNIEVTDVVGNPSGTNDLHIGLEYALIHISALRQQLFEMLGRKPPTLKVED